MASVLACPTAELEWVPTDMTKDGAGNIVSKVTETPASGGTVITETRTFNNLNQLTQNVVNTVTTSPYSNTTVTWTLTYDASGNLHTKSDGTNLTTYTWDEDNRLTQVSLPGGATISYTYDVAGRMLTRTDWNGTSTFVWNGTDCTQETDYQGNVTRYCVVNGTLMSFDRQGTVYQIHADALGSVRKVTDPSGSVMATYDFDAWGSPLASTSDSIPNGGLEYRFVGAYGLRWDSATTLFYVRQRWYDPAVGRFVSRDSNKSLLNTYAYALNNPTRLVDIDGSMPVDPPPNPINPNTGNPWNNDIQTGPNTDFGHWGGQVKTSPGKLQICLNPPKTCEGIKANQIKITDPTGYVYYQNVSTRWYIGALANSFTPVFNANLPPGYYNVEFGAEMAYYDWSAFWPELYKNTGPGFRRCFEVYVPPVPPFPITGSRSR
jgi:RHS repeat-associated protein